MSKDKKEFIKSIIALLILICGVFLIILIFRETLTGLQNYFYAKPNNGSILWLESSFTSYRIALVGIIIFIILALFLLGKDKKSIQKNRSLRKILSITLIVTIVLSSTTIYIMAIRNFAYCTDNKIVYRGFVDAKESSYDFNKIYKIYTETHTTYTRRTSRDYINLVVQFNDENKIIIKVLPSSDKGIKQILENTNFDIEFDTLFAEEEFVKRYK